LGLVHHDPSGILAQPEARLKELMILELCQTLNPGKAAEKI
jgi:hypothetical protein